MSAEKLVDFLKTVKTEDDFSKGPFFMNISENAFKDAFAKFMATRNRVLEPRCLSLPLDKMFRDFKLSTVIKGACKQRSNVSTSASSVVKFRKTRRVAVDEQSLKSDTQSIDGLTDVLASEISFRTDDREKLARGIRSKIPMIDQSDKLIAAASNQLNMYMDMDRESYKWSDTDGITGEPMVVKMVERKGAKIYRLKLLNSISAGENFLKYKGSAAATNVINRNRSSCHDNVTFADEARVAFILEKIRQHAESLIYSTCPIRGQMFDRFELEDRESYALFKTVVGIVGNSNNSDTSAASAIENIFSKMIPFDNDSYPWIISQIFPMLDRCRFDTHSMWLDVGRALKNAYSETSFLCIDIWAELTSQHRLISEICNIENLENVFSRKIIAAYINYGGRGKDGVLKHPDVFDMLYEKPSSETTDMYINSVKGDTFARRVFGVFANLMPDDVLKICIDEGLSIGDINKAFLNFRDGYKTLFNEHHIHTAHAYFHERKDIGAMDLGRVDKDRELIEDEDVFNCEDMSTSTINDDVFDFFKDTFACSTVAVAAAAAAADGNVISTKDTGNYDSPLRNLYEDMIARIPRTGDHVADSVIIDNIKNACKLGYKTITADDYAWGSEQENNVALMFFSEIRNNNLAAEIANKIVQNKQNSLNSYPKIRDLLASGNYREAVGEFVKMSTTMHENDISYIVECFLDFDLDQIKEKCRNEYKLTLLSEKPSVSVRTLASYARNDFPNAYETWHSQWVDFSLFSAIKNNDKSDIGRFVARALWLDYMCVPNQSIPGTRGGGSGVSWYRLAPNTHYLVKLQGTAELEQDIISRIGQHIFALTKSVKENLRKHESRIIALNIDKRLTETNLSMMRDISEPLKKLAVKLEKLDSSLSNGITVNSVIRSMVSYMFLKPVSMFSDLENADPYKFAFENGVMVLSDEGDVIFRDGKLEDYITKSTRIDMPYGGIVTPHKSFRNYTNEVYSENHPEIAFLDDYLSKVFPNEELVDFAIRVMASFLFGRNSEKKFGIWSGCGNNSKSVLIKIIQRGFGDYVVSIPAEAICTKQFRNSSAPSPELAQTEGTHLGVMAEPSDGMTIDAGILKRLTGGDENFFRRLHENGKSHAMTNKLVMLCNDTPDFSGVDEAVKERVLVLPFLSTWKKIEDCPSTEEEQNKALIFPIDPFFERNVGRLARALMWKLAHNYKKYRTLGISELPEIVKNSITGYWGASDKTLKFKNFAIEPADDDHNPPLSIKQLYSLYKTWFVDSFGDTKIPNAKTFETSITRNYVLGPTDVELKGKIRAWSKWRLRDRSGDGMAATQMVGSSTELGIWADEVATGVI